MKLCLLLGPCLLVSCANIPSSEHGTVGLEDRKTNQLAFYLGQRSLDETDYEPVEDQGTFGIEFSQEIPGNAVGWEAGLFGSGDEGTFAGFDVEGSTGEIFGGIRKSFGENAVRPYFGAGLAFINSEVKVHGVGSDDDSSPAAYFHVGISVDASDAVRLGLDLRFLVGSDLEIAGVDTDADYGQLAIFVGFGL